MRYYFFCAIKFLVLSFPRKFCYFCAKIIAYFYGLAAKSDREAIIYNLSPFVPKDKLKEVTLKVFTNFSYYLVDFFRYDKLTKKFIDDHVTIVGKDNLDKALEDGRGVILLTAHLGNYELGGAATSLIGYNMNVVALPHKDKRTNRLFDRQRERAGLKVIPTGAGIKACFKVLEKNNILAMLGDRSFGGKVIEVDILGQKALLPRGFAFFSKQTKAVIVPAFFVRDKNKYKYNLFFEKPIYPDNVGEDFMVGFYARILGKYIKEYPDQWYTYVKYWQ